MPRKIKREHIKLNKYQVTNESVLDKGVLQHLRVEMEITNLT